MKIFDGRYNQQILIGILMMHGLLCAESGRFTNLFFDDQPTTTLPAYQNKILGIVYSAGSDDQFAITFLCEQSPICIYTPLRYEDTGEGSRTKTYVLPFTSCMQSQAKYLYEDLPKMLKKSGISLKVEAMKTDRTLKYFSKYYGIRMTFTMESDEVYDITKVIDADKKLVSFNIIGKM